MHGDEQVLATSEVKPRSTGLWHSAPQLMRISSHIAVWVSVLGSLAIELARGWRPVQDNAAIASHAFQTFTSHPPLVGMSSTAGDAGHTAYGPGPLEFWLLAVPVRIDATHGLLWGAALLAGAALSLAIEALWSSRFWPGCGVVAFAVVDMMWLTPSVLENISWNAYFPIPFFIATLALAWVVSTGRFGWWPPMVFVASVASQSHLIFSFPCTLLALAAPVLGLTLGGRTERLRWLWIGFGVAAACWTAPLLQQLFGVQGNIATLFSSQSGRAKLGFHFALSVIGRIGRPSPVWLTRQPTTFFPLVHFENDAGPVVGLAIFGLLAAVAVRAWITQRRTLVALAGVGLVGLVGVLVAYAMIPTDRSISTFYLLNLLWPFGILVWATLGWAVATVVADIAGRRHRKTQPVSESNSHPDASMRRVGIPALLGIAVITIVCVLGIRQFAGFRPTEATVSWNTSEAASVAAIAPAIERAVPAGPVAFLVVGTSNLMFSTRAIELGVGWQLLSDGWAPGLQFPDGTHAGLVIPADKAYTAVAVTMAGDRVISVRTAPCRTSPAQCLGISH